MNKLLVTILISGLFISCQQDMLFTTIEQSDAQNFITANPIELNSNDTLYTQVDKMPEFPGGKEELLQFIKSNLRYPLPADSGTYAQGRVIVQFIINKDGKAINPTILRSVSPELDEQVINIVNQMPQWNPGEYQEKKVNVKFTLPVQFKTPSDGSKNLVYDYNKVDKVPEYPGGHKKLREDEKKYMLEKFPPETHPINLPKQVMVQFIVNEDGTIGSSKILKSANDTLDKEAIRFVDSMPKWTPGEYKGKKVKVKINTGIHFMF